MTTYYVATTGNDTTGDGSIGNPFASPGKAAAVATSAGDVVYVKSGTYTLSTSVAGAGGPVALASVVKVTMEGYQTTPGDLLGRPVLSAGAISNVTLFVSDGSSSLNPHRFINLEADANGQALVVGFDVMNRRHFAIKCKATRCSSGFVGSGHIHGCEASGCTEGFRSSITANCTATSCVIGFVGFDMVATCCLAFDCTAEGFSSTARSLFARCTSRDNGGDGFALGQSSNCVDCVAENNGAYGFDGDSSCAAFNCYAGANTSGASNVLQIADVTDLIVDTAIDAASNDFQPNNESGGGAVIRGAAGDVPTQSDNTDAGAIQHADPVGGATRPRIYVGGRLRT